MNGYVAYCVVTDTTPTGRVRAYNVLHIGSGVVVASYKVTSVAFWRRAHDAAWADCFARIT